MAFKPKAPIKVPGQVPVQDLKRKPGRYNAFWLQQASSKTPCIRRAHLRNTGLGDPRDQWGYGKPRPTCDPVAAAEEVACYFSTQVRVAASSVLDGETVESTYNSTATAIDNIVYEAEDLARRVALIHADHATQEMKERRDPDDVRLNVGNTDMHVSRLFDAIMDLVGEVASSVSVDGTLDELPPSEWSADPDDEETPLGGVKTADDLVNRFDEMTPVKFRNLCRVMQSRMDKHLKQEMLEVLGGA